MWFAASLFMGGREGVLGRTMVWRLKKAYLVYLVAGSFSGIEMRLCKSWVEKNHFIYFDNSTVSKWTDSKCWRVLAYHVERLNSLALSAYSEGDKFLLAMDLPINFSVDSPKLLSGNVCRLSCNNQQLKIKWAALRRLSVYIFWTRFSNQYSSN